MRGRANSRPVLVAMTRFVLLTAVWKRPLLTKIVLQTYERMRQVLSGEIEICLLAVGSEGAESRALCEGCGFDYLEHPNSPLSHKWNAGVQAAKRYDPDALIIVGSDDLVSVEMFRIYADKLREGLHFFGVSDMYFFEPVSLRLGYWGGYEYTTMKNRTGEPIGCGRCFGRSVLDRTGWNLWPREPRLDSLLDRLALNYVKVHGFRPTSWKLGEIGAKAVDIKLGTNITPFDGIDYQKKCDGEQALEYVRPLLSEDDLAQLMQLHDRENPA